MSARLQAAGWHLSLHHSDCQRPGPDNPQSDFQRWEGRGNPTLQEPARASSAQYPAPGAWVGTDWGHIPFELDSDILSEVPRNPSAASLRSADTQGPGGATEQSPRKVQ